VDDVQSRVGLRGDHFVGEFGVVEALEVVRFGSPDVGVFLDQSKAVVTALHADAVRTLVDCKQTDEQTDEHIDSKIDEQMNR